MLVKLSSGFKNRFLFALGETKQKAWHLSFFLFVRRNQALTDKIGRGMTGRDFQLRGFRSAESEVSGYRKEAMGPMQHQRSGRDRSRSGFQ